MLTSFGLASLALFFAALAVWQIFALRKHLHIDDQMATKKWAKAVKGPRFQVTPRNDIYPTGTNPSQADFFQSTSGIVPWLNRIYSDTQWSFEDEGKLELEPFNGAERKIVIRYGQQKTGSLQVSAIDYESDSDFLNGRAKADLEIINARFWAFHDVYGISISIVHLIADLDNLREAEQQAALAAMECMWRLGPEAFGNPDFDFSVSGKGLARIKSTKGVELAK